MNYIEQNRDFKGVWIPKDIWLNDNLTMIEKVILIEIDSLDNEDHCVAGNEYLAQFCQCSEWKVSTAIKKLTHLGYIEIISFDGRHRRLKSCLRKFQGQTLENPKAESGKPKAINIDNNLETNLDIYNGETSSPDVSTQPTDTFSEQYHSVNKPIPQSTPQVEKYTEEIKQIIDYLNLKANKSYRANTPNTIKLITARLNQKYTVDNFKHVIDVKCAEWLNTEFEKFLRPDTLFSEKHFEDYLNTKMPANKTADRAGQPNTQYKKANLADICDESY